MSLELPDAQISVNSCLNLSFLIYEIEIMVNYPILHGCGGTQVGGGMQRYEKTLKKIYQIL
jgi:hypothetical protein